MVCTSRKCRLLVFFTLQSLLFQSWLPYFLFFLFCPRLSFCHTSLHHSSIPLPPPPPLTHSSSPDASGQQQPSSVGAQPHSGASDPGPIRATAPMWRCSRIMHMQRELHPTLLSSLEGIVDQMVWFRENWHEEVRRTKVLVSCVSDFVATCVCF